MINNLVLAINNHLICRHCKSKMYCGLLCGPWHFPIWACSSRNCDYWQYRYNDPVVISKDGDMRKVYLSDRGKTSKSPVGIGRYPY